MPSSSQMRKEEAELRKIAKQSRLSRKEAAARERRREKRMKNTTGPSTNTTRRRGAIILPAEVEEMRQRMLTDAPSATSGRAKSGGVNVGGDKQKGAKRQRPSSASPASSASSLHPRLQEPPYGIEVHYKKEQILVDVKLHHVPPVHVDISETTDEMLVVDTSKHTKKYRLELPIPEGMRINANQAEYEFDVKNGVLNCVLPIKGEIPNSLKAEREKILDNIRRQKALRFRISEDGELKVRSRRALLAKSERAQAALMEEERKKKMQAEQEVVDAGAGEDEDKNKEETAAATDSSKKEARGRKTQPKRKKNNANEEEEPPKKRSKKEISLTPHSGAEQTHDAHKGGCDKSDQPERKTPRPNTKKAVVSGVFDEEHKKALEIAKSAGKAAQMTLRERIAHAKLLQRKMQERLAVRSSRRQLRSERTQESLSRILEEQKRQLLARAELNASIAASEKKVAAGRKENGKTVTFAAGTKGAGE
ncbi:hypothetical protein MOQ_008282 [Trypanosoma cruzi marinkellei]|uniref:Uncharacterized protein n=1 Tax=Trypanosoma cruzi marinkellei TaxID=85056 RepID=K2NG80_TRYCR|nr:hypothetical protein MOQ_008282 [Trypanosoma cruzi marinkellei]